MSRLKTQTLSQKRPRRRRPTSPFEEALEAAELLLEKGPPEQALTHFDHLLERYPTEPAAYLGRGRAHLLYGDHDRARADFDRAYTLAPTSAEAHYFLGRLSEEANQPEEALRHYRKAEELGPNALIHFAIGKLLLRQEREVGALDAFGKAFARDHRAFDALSQRGKIFMNHECYVAALADFSVCCLLHPDEPQHWIGRGNAYYELGDFELATRDYLRAKALDAQLPELSLNLGCIALDIDDIEGALVHFNDALSKNPRYARALLNRGLAYFYQDRRELAESDFLAAIECEPEEADAHFALARLLAKEHRYRRAAESLAAALALAPDYVDEILDDPVFSDLRKLREVKRSIALADERLS